MKTADELFKELGYEKVREDNDSYEIRYVKKFGIRRGKHIVFFCDKTISVCSENKKGLAVDRDYFNMQELKAINQKCKELGWLDD